MTQQHPITPPPELVQQWAHEWNTLGIRHPDATNTASYVATQTAQWGSDTELEACCEWLGSGGYAGTCFSLRAARRPKPPSLKEQALEIVRGTPVNSAGLYSHEDVDTIRRALEQLDD